MSQENEDFETWKKQKSIFRRNTPNLVRKILEMLDSSVETNEKELNKDSIQLKQQRDELKNLIFHAYIIVFFWILFPVDQCIYLLV